MNLEKCQNEFGVFKGTVFVTLMNMINEKRHRMMLHGGCMPIVLRVSTLNLIDLQDLGHTE